MKKISKISPHKPKIKLPGGSNYLKVKNIVHKHNLHTICESGRCPNLSECWGNGTATFMILGNICTRSCKFCSVPSGRPFPPDEKEPQKIAESIKLMGLSHSVITSVDRDDLPDYGASHWKETINTIKELNPNITIEVLIPDFNFDKTALDKIIEAKPDVVAHNLETVKRLTAKVRSKASYERSLAVLQYIQEKGITTKSGIMVGLGETEDEIYQTMDDLLAINCKIITIGQYLRPTPKQMPVYRYVSDAQFKKYKKTAFEKGFKFVESGALVRSSYHAERIINKEIIKN